MLSNNKLLTFSAADIRVIIGQLHKSKHWFSDTSIWLETFFHYSGLSDQRLDVSIQLNKTIIYLHAYFCALPKLLSR